MSGIVQIALADGHGLRVDAAFLHRLTDTVGYILQKLVAHIDGAFLQLQNDVLGVSVHRFLKIAVVIDLTDQLVHHRAAVLALIVLHILDNGLAVLVQPFDFQHQTALVIFYLDLGVDAQQHGADGLAFRRRLFGGLCAAACQQGQRQCGRGGQGEGLFPIHLLHSGFSNRHLLSAFVCLMDIDYAAAF